jgi:RNA recognition motif-containing protein
VTVLIDRLPTEWGSTDVSELLHPFGPSHVCMAADACGNLLGFAFVFFADERSANKAVMALDLMDTPGLHLSVTRAVAPRGPGEVTG